MKWQFTSHILVFYKKKLEKFLFVKAKPKVTRKFNKKSLAHSHKYHPFATTVNDKLLKKV
uniref:Uncharacterized protein n=1 Tax=Rhizophagus irregularis (strain DAOM 181602 / DAOM 197198 / MUCL 43194) TaxID=747089 RepID=U9UTW6_RHIID